MSPSQIANLEATFLERAREHRIEPRTLANDYAAAAWTAAAALLIEAAGKKPTRRKFRPMDLNRIQG